MVEENCKKKNTNNTKTTNTNKYLVNRAHYWKRGLKRTTDIYKKIEGHHICRNKAAAMNKREKRAMNQQQEQGSTCKDATKCTGTSA